jgi:hypothetical protein
VLITQLLRQRRIPFTRLTHSPEICLACPQCARLGLKTENPRLFFHTRKRVGHCFRCGWGGTQEALLDLLKVRPGPVFDRQGNYRTFVSRAIDSHAEKKYLFPKGAAISHLLYNLHFIQGSSVWLTEGIFDAIHCYPHAVATFGKYLSAFQLMLLRLHGIDTVYLLWDAEAWQQSPDLWNRAVTQLKNYFFTYPVKLARDTPTEYTLHELKQLCGASEI